VKNKGIAAKTPFSRPPAKSGGGYKVKISHFYTFVLFRETYNIVGRY